MSKEILSIKNRNEPHLELILTRTHVKMRLGDEAQYLLKQEMAAESSHLEGFSWVHKLKTYVLEQVDKLIHKSIEYSLDEINDIEYIDGYLEFDYATKHFLTFDFISIGDDDDSILGDFSDEDSEHFVKAFQIARKKYMEFLKSD